MVKPKIINFDVVCRGTLNWCLSIDGDDEPTPFVSRSTCAAAARVRARRHHQDYGISTQVRLPTLDGSMEIEIRYLTPLELEQSCHRSSSSRELRQACEHYGGRASSS
ncbi:hypothetical protein [Lysobacter antibioticus]|uniref:hypothetical protein n=1 Tax=Lysobacter antibioticus TaxID=84531 RepID=UPI00126A085C|nr:hypothetical protein [Lysobacter antibioticus]